MHVTPSQPVTCDALKVEAALFVRNLKTAWRPPFLLPQLLT